MLDMKLGIYCVIPLNNRTPNPGLAQWDDFMHLGMISDLLDDSPGGLF